MFSKTRSANLLSDDGRLHAREVALPKWLPVFQQRAGAYWFALLIVLCGQWLPVRAAVVSTSNTTPATPLEIVWTYSCAGDTLPFVDFVSGPGQPGTGQDRLSEFQATPRIPVSPPCPGAQIGTVQGLASFLSAEAVGSSFTFKAEGAPQLHYEIVRDCSEVAGQDTSVLFRTTIGSISAGAVTPSPDLPNPGCRGFCKVEFSLIQRNQAVGFVASDATVEVGTELFMSVFGTYNGQVCEAGVPETSSLITSGELKQASEEDPETGLACVDDNGDSLDDATGTVCELACNDANADGRDDETKIMCGAEVQAAVMKEVNDLSRQLLNEEISADELSGYFPSSILLPPTIKDWLRSDECDAFAFPAFHLPLLNLEIQPFNACNMKAQYGLVFQFAMFVLTFFILAGAYRWAIT